MTVERSGDIYFERTIARFEPQLSGVFDRTSVPGFHRPRLSIN